jgi:hypothetical protein
MKPPVFCKPNVGMFACEGNDFLSTFSNPLIGGALADLFADDSSDEDCT